jgi:4-carboxymuconolactone decarboxylase
MTDTPDRTQKGAQTMAEVLAFKVERFDTPLNEAARDFVFAEVWSRPGLDRRTRRFITLACVCAARSPVAIRTYLNAALESGDIEEPELREFLLQFAVFQGFPKAVEAEAILNELVAARASKQV